MLMDELMAAAWEKDSRRKVVDVRAGLGYTCVRLEDGKCGLAYTFRDRLGAHCSALGEAGSLIGKEARELVPWVKSDHLLQAALGLAAINSLLNDPEENWPEGNVVTALPVSTEERLGLVGDFMPIRRRLAGKIKDVVVFEQGIREAVPLEGGMLYPEEEIPRRLPECDVIVVTATSLINHTIEKILPCCQNAKQVCLVGGSTPLAPEVFASCNIHLLAGSVVTDVEKLLPIISQGGGTMEMKPALRQVLVRTEGLSV